MVKKIVWILPVFVCFLASNSLAGYLIQLKNGRILSTSRYWVEKGEVKFQWSDGTAGIPKGLILSIRKMEESSAGGGISALKEPALEPEKAAMETPRRPQRAADKLPGEASVDMAYYQRQKDFYTQRYEQAYARYLEAVSRRDEEAKKKAWDEFTLYGGQVISLEEELKKKNQGVLPAWWKK